MKIEKELVRGGAALAVLQVLSEGDSYGYAIIQTLAQRSENVFRLSTGTLYPILHAMVKQRYLDTYDKNVSEGRVRRYYHITALGCTQLGLLTAEWRVFSSGMEGVLAGGTNEK